MLAFLLKNPPVMKENLFKIPSGEDPLEKRIGYPLQYLRLLVAQLEESACSAGDLGSILVGKTSGEGKASSRKYSGGSNTTTVVHGSQSIGHRVSDFHFHSC